MYIYVDHSMNKNFFWKMQINFFHICKLCIVWNWLIVKTYLISSKYLFWANSKCQQINQNGPGLNRSRPLNFWWPRSSNYVNLTKECAMYIEKYCVCVCVCLYFVLSCMCVCNNPSTQSIFMRSLTGLNSECSFSGYGCLIYAKEPSLPKHLPISGEKIMGFIPFPWVLVICEIKTTLYRIRTRSHQVHFLRL